MDNFNILVSGGFQAEDLVSDGWTDIIRKLLVMVQQDPGANVTPGGIAKTLELADFQKMEQIRARVDAIVADPATAEALKPYYRQFCKRPCFHDEYLDDLQPAERHARRHAGAGASSGSPRRASSRAAWSTSSTA